MSDDNTPPPFDQQRDIDTFCGITGAKPDRSRSYLEAHNWNIDNAVSTFFDETPEATLQTLSPNNSQGSTSSDNKTYDTMKDMRSDQAKIQSGKKDQYFAGGSESSGQLIEGLPEKNADIVSHVFESAKAQGAESIDEHRRNENQASKNPEFQGTGYRLGSSETEDSKIVKGAPPPQKPVVFKIGFYKTGFTINDGELRLFDDENNKQFMLAVSKGYIPNELMNESKGRPVHIEMDDHRDEEYVHKKEKLEAFKGSGQRLGNITPDFSSGTSTQSNSTPEVAPLLLPPCPIEVDTSQPVTTIQIRLGDGTRVAQKFNHTHTVGDLRNFVQCRTPSLDITFVIMTTFPNKELTDNHLTLKDAQLINAVVVQRYK